MPFDPALLSGKLLWLRAKDLGASGSSVNSWPDQSGAAHDAYRGAAAPTVATSSTPLGGKSVRFAGSSDLHFTNYRGIPIAAATASSFFAGAPSFPPINAIDGLPEQGGYNSVWASNTMPAWLRLQPVSATVVTSYGMTARIGLSVDQSPKDWTFQGSNDGSSWTTLDTQTAVSFAMGESKTYSFSNATAYTYYRINITAVNGSTLAALADFSLNPAAGYGTVNNPLTASQTAAEIWVVVKSDTGGNRGMWSWGQDSASGIESYYPYSDGRVYESFGVTVGNRQNFLPTEPTSSWQIYRVRNDGTTWEAWQSGVTQLTATSKPFGYGAYQTIGVTRSSSANFANFTGNIAEVYMRDQISTTQEASDLYAYLLAEHFSASSTSIARAESIYTEALASGAATIQTEGVYAEAITTAGFGVRAEAVYAEAIATAPLGVQAESIYFETLMAVQPAQVETVYAEAVLTGTPSARIETVYTEIVLLSTPLSQIESVYMELVLHALPAARYVGWGMPR